MVGEAHPAPPADATSATGALRRPSPAPRQQHTSERFVPRWDLSGETGGRPPGRRRRPLLAILFLAMMTVACDSSIAFYIRNDTPENYFVRVTTDRQYVYVHDVGSNKSGYATRGVVPGPPGPDYMLELLDSGCNVLDTWQMPSDGGLLEIRGDGRAEFTPGGYYFDETPSGGGSSAGAAPSESPTDEPFPTVLDCGATDVFAQ